MASVNICPKTETDVLIASRRLGCDNHTNDRDPYMCIPNKEKTSLVEFCYNSVMGIHEKGNCLEASVGMVTEYSCKNFSYGCPDKSFFKDELYKYPACQDINTKYQCYVMDPSCPRHSNYEPTVNYDTIIYACAIPITIFVIGALYGIFKRLIQERQQAENLSDEMTSLHTVPPSTNEDENKEDDTRKALTDQSKNDDDKEMEPSAEDSAYLCSIAVQLDIKDEEDRETIGPTSTIEADVKNVT